MKKTAVLLVLLLSLAAAGNARTERPAGIDSICATRLSTAAISYARHQFNQRRLRLTAGSRLAVGEPGIQQGFRVAKQKNIAVIEDGGTIFPPPNLFDLGGAGVQFKRGGPGTRAERFFGGVSDDRGDRIEIGDDASRTIDLPFGFTFYGTAYNRVFLNSDGNLTFLRAENASTERGVARFLEGPPRIAVNFLDLDPSVTAGQAGVYLLRRSDLVRVTWLQVPRFDLDDSNTFQVTLYPNGRITMVYGGVDSPAGIVGVSPGGPGTLNLVDLSRQLPLGTRTDAIAESFREVSEIDDLAASRAVLSVVRDEYDVIVLFADFPVDLGGAFAYNAPVSNEIRGIGDGEYDWSDQYGSNGRLRAFVQMGSLENYPASPNRNIPFSEATGIGILAHEVGHRWLALARFIDAQGQRSFDLLGRQTAHWSFNLDSDGSVLEGNDIRDNGDGTFTTVATWQGFSPLDEYLMGLRRPDQVPPFFYVSGTGQDKEAAPDTGVTLSGQRVDVTIGQVIAAMGPRVPAQTTKPTQVAFALLGRQGEPPSLASIRKVNQYRNRLSTFYRQQTEDQGRIATWLRLRRRAVGAPAAAALPGAEGTEPEGSVAESRAAAAVRRPADTRQPAVPRQRLEEGSRR